MAVILLAKKNQDNYVLVFLKYINNDWLIYSDLALRAANFSLKCSIADPKIQ
jgi:hypothetical protein